MTVIQLLLVLGAIDMAVAELRFGRNEQLRRLAQKIVAQDQGFMAESQKRGMHADGLVAHVQARKTGKGVGDPLLPTRLHVGEFGV